MQEGGDERPVLCVIPQHFVNPEPASTLEAIKALTANAQALFIVEAVEKISDEQSVTSRNLPGKLERIHPDQLDSIAQTMTRQYR